MPKKKFPMVRVDWVDTTAHKHGWMSAESACIRPLKCCSVGLLVKKGRKGVSLTRSMTLDKETQIDDTLDIPKGCITKLTYLKGK